MPSPSVPNTFSNSTTADATQVNDNFTALINGMTDGTKDFSINALTCAGTATFNGNVTLGNASGDDITFTGSMASSLPVKTTASFDVGSSTIGLRYIYFGNSTFTLRVAAPTLGASYNLSLPLPDDIQARTTTASAAGSDGTIKCDTSGGGWTLSLPAAANFGRKRLCVIKTTSDFNVLTIDGNGSETINGATTTTLNTQYEAVELLCDGSNWFILNRTIPSLWTSYSPTVGTTGGASTPTGYWKRVGDSILIQFDVIWTSIFTGGSLTITIPSGLTIDTGKIPGTATANTQKLGDAELWDVGTGTYLAAIFYSTTSVMALRSLRDDQGAGGSIDADGISTTAPFTWANNDKISGRTVAIPISGWNG